MKSLIWLDKEECTIGGVGTVREKSIFEIDNKRADSFIKQKKARLSTAADVKAAALALAKVEAEAAKTKSVVEPVEKEK